MYMFSSYRHYRLAVLQVYAMMAKLAVCHDLNGRQDLFELYTRGVLTGLQDGYAHWTQHSVERHIFDALLMESGTQNENHSSSRKRHQQRKLAGVTLL